MFNSVSTIYFLNLSCNSCEKLPNSKKSMRPRWKTWCLTTNIQHSVRMKWSTCWQTSTNTDVVCWLSTVAVCGTRKKFHRSNYSAFSIWFIWPPWSRSIHKYVASLWSWTLAVWVWNKSNRWRHHGPGDCWHSFKRQCLCVWSKCI